MPVGYETLVWKILDNQRKSLPVKPLSDNNVHNEPVVDEDDEDKTDEEVNEDDEAEELDDEAEELDETVFEEAEDMPSTLAFDSTLISRSAISRAATLVANDTKCPHDHLHLFANPYILQDLVNSQLSLTLRPTLASRQKSL